MACLALLALFPSWLAAQEPPRSPFDGTTPGINTPGWPDVTRVTDPRGVRADFDYSTGDARGTYALLTKITRYPTIGQTSPALVESFTNDYDLARPVEHIDSNNHTTSYAHADSLNRLIEITRPDGSRTQFLYSDFPGAVSVTTRQDLNTAGDGVVETSINYDGLGREARTVQQEGGGAIVVDYQYDSRGRLYRVTPPYRGSPPGYTVSEYDGTNRLVRVTEPDGTATTTAYQNNLATVTDPATKARRTETDALGQVASVTEDPSGLNYGTACVYDALDNLTAVTQGSQARTFVYDSLGRLRRAVNPESGAVTYGYDDSGNLASRLDARNQPSRR